MCMILKMQLILCSVPIRFARSLVAYNNLREALGKLIGKVRADFAQFHQTSSQQVVGIWEWFCFQLDCHLLRFSTTMS